MAPDLSASLRFGLIFAAHALGAMSVLAVLTAGPQLVAELGLSQLQLGGLASVYSAALALASLPAGLVTDRIGTRRALTIAAGLIALGLLLASVAQGFALLSAGMALCGMGYGLINPAAGRAVTIWFTPAWRATLMSLKQTGVPVGAALGSASAGLGLIWGWQGGVLAAAGLAAGAALLFWVCLPQEHTPPRAKTPQSGSLEYLRAVLYLPRLGRANLAAGLTNGGQFALWALLAEALRLSVGASAALLALSMGALHLGMFLGRVFWGVLSDRVLNRDAALALRLLCLLALIGAGGFWVVGASGAILLVPVSVFLLGFTICAATGLHVAVTAALAPPHQIGAAIGYTMVITNLGGVAAPLLLGAALQHGNVAGFALGLAGMMLAAFVLLRPARLSG